MAPSRLNDSQKQELVARYRAGDATSSLAADFGCSVNTVSRTVRNLLSAEDYQALKTARARGKAAVSELPAVSEQPQDAAPVDGPAVMPAVEADEAQPATAPEAPGDSVAHDPAEDPANQFHEVAILTDVTHADSHPPVICQPLAPGVLPDSVYMLVDKVVELDPRPLRDFPEVGALDPADQERQALGLFATPRTAKRQCGRNQRVIRVPDTSVFTQTASYLLARGITRLVLEGTLISLDA